MRLRRVTLGTKFNLLTISCILLTSVGVASYAVRNEMEATRREHFNHGRSIALVVSQNLEYGIYTENKEQIQQVVGAVFADPIVSHVAVLNQKNEVLVFLSEDSGLAPSHAASPARTDNVTSVQASLGDGDGGYVDLIVPVVSSAKGTGKALFGGENAAAPTAIGYVHLGVDARALRARIRHLLVSTSIFTLFAVLIGTAVTILVTKKISSPLRALGQAAHAISDGRLDQKVDIRTRDEIEDLAVSFGHMQGNLRQYRTQVEERTTALVETNRKMQREIAEREQAQAALRNSEQQLMQAQKMQAVGKLAGGVAHDFNNLLTVVTGYAEMVRDELPDGSPIREDVATILGAAQRASRLTGQLLAFSRKQVMQARIVDLNGMVASIEKMLRRLIGEDIVLETSFGEDVGCVKVDPGQFDQVIINLAVNARDAMPLGGTLSITTTRIEVDADGPFPGMEIRSGSYTLIQVTDSGQGMDAETQSHIFEPFFTTKEVGKGTGLGLATVYGIVKQSGGHISVASAPGRGAAFRILLPSADAPQIDEAVSDSSSSRPGGETIFVVEDEEWIRSLICDRLTMLGYKTVSAGDGRNGLEVANRHVGPIHLLLTDVVMPGMSGVELARELKQRHPTMKVLYMSGYTDDAMVRHGVSESETAFIQKPFSTDALRQKVAEVLGVSRLPDAPTADGAFAFGVAEAVS